MKRFTETEKWRDPWFQKLDRESRTLWLWLCDRVDNAGVIDICWPICNAETGGTYSEESLKALEDKVERLETGKWWLPGFVNFQVGKLSEHCKPHIYIINLLNKHNLYHRVSHRVCNTFKEQEQEKEKEKDTESFKLSKAQKLWFDEFYENYPKSSDKKGCLKLWAELNVSFEMKEKILNSIKETLKSGRWSNPDFIPLPINWLEKRRWEDKIKTNGQIIKRPSLQEIEANE